VEDLAKWSVALAGGKVIPLESYRQMITPKKLTDGTPLPYGFITHNSYYLERKLHIVVLTNSGSGKPSKLTAELAEAALIWNGK